MFNLIVMLLLGEARASEYVVLLNARNPTASVGSSELKKIYLGQMAFWHGVVPMSVVMRPPASDVGSGFLDGVLNVSAQKYERTWASKQLSGQGIAPALAPSVDEVVAAVAAQPGGIGFLLATEADGLPATVKTLPIPD